MQCPLENTLPDDRAMAVNDVRRMIGCWAGHRLDHQEVGRAPSSDRSTKIRGAELAPIPPLFLFLVGLNFTLPRYVPLLLLSFRFNPWFSVYPLFSCSSSIIPMSFLDPNTGLPLSSHHPAQLTLEQQQLLLQRQQHALEAQLQSLDRNRFASCPDNLVFAEHSLVETAQIPLTATINPLDQLMSQRFVSQPMLQQQQHPSISLQQQRQQQLQQLTIHSLRAERPIPPPLGPLVRMRCGSDQPQQSLSSPGIPHGGSLPPSFSQNAPNYQWYFSQAPLNDFNSGSRHTTVSVSDSASSTPPGILAVDPVSLVVGGDAGITAGFFQDISQFAPVSPLDAQVQLANGGVAWDPMNLGFPAVSMGDCASEQQFVRMEGGNVVNAAVKQRVDVASSVHSGNPRSSQPEIDNSGADENMDAHSVADSDSDCDSIASGSTGRKNGTISATASVTADDDRTNTNNTTSGSKRKGRKYVMSEKQKAAKRVRNKISARLSRTRKVQQVKDLEDRIASLEGLVTELQTANTMLKSNYDAVMKKWIAEKGFAGGRPTASSEN